MKLGILVRGSPKESAAATPKAYVGKSEKNETLEQFSS
jgi:hypothetical protein